VFQDCRSAVLLGDDVLTVEGQEIGVVRVQPAAFAPTACSLADHMARRTAFIIYLAIWPEVGGHST
jgi:hypothetical protein